LKLFEVIAFFYFRHVGGFIGKSVTRGRIQAIFATDPAGILRKLN
jgi:hypothetical protein